MATVFLILIFVGVFSFCLLFLLLRARSNIEREVRSKLADFRSRVEDFDRRIALIDTHAIDYMNSLSKDASQALYEAHQVLNSAHRVIEEVEVALAARDFPSLKEIVLLLDLLLIGKRPSQQVEDPSFASLFEVGYWHSKIERMLQLIGGEVTTASIKASVLGIPKRRKRQPTIDSLARAGVNVGLFAAENIAKKTLEEIKTSIRKEDEEMDVDLETLPKHNKF